MARFVWRFTDAAAALAAFCTFFFRPSAWRSTFFIFFASFFFFRCISSFLDPRTIAFAATAFFCAFFSAFREPAFAAFLNDFLAFLIASFASLDFILIFFFLTLSLPALVFFASFFL